MEMERYRTLFLDESFKHVQAVEEQMLGAEEVEGEMLDSVFREIHSLKGMSASMGFGAMAELAHKFEDLLDSWRKGESSPPDGCKDLCLRVCDRLTEMRDDIASGGKGELEWSDLDAEINEASPKEVLTQNAGELFVKITISPDCESPAARAYLILRRFKEIDPNLRSTPSEDEIVKGVKTQSLEMSLIDMDRCEAEAIYETLTEVDGIEFGEGEAAKSTEDAQAPPSDEPAPSFSENEVVSIEIFDEEQPAAEAEGKIRLPENVQAPVRLLDEFVDLLGEMTIARSHVEDIGRNLKSEMLLEEVDRLEKVIRSFHQRIMSLRMLPFSLITGNLKRLVRQHSASLGKEVALSFEGREIGMDKSILLQVSDPLIHLLRNSLDHGLEKPEQRQKKGKPETGEIKIKAERKRNRVEITVSDDGRGIDVESVRKKAVEAGLYKEDESRRMGQAEILSCLFRPGFTTRSTVSELSGRGVGLDVVKSAVDALGGAIEISSTPGKGTTFRLSLPLSVAIIPVLMVLIGGSTLAFPVASIESTLEAHPQDIRTKDGQHVLLTERGKVRIHSLAKMLRLEGRQKFERVPLIIVQTGSGLAALAVDSFLREEDLFIKPLKGPLRNLEGISGYSVMGDGRLVFLLEPATLFKL